MNSYTLERAIELLENASAVIIDNDVLIYPRVDDGDDEEFLTLSWDTEGEEYTYNFLRKDNRVVNIKDNQLVLVADEGTEFNVTLLEPQTLKS